jgi:MFS family permease
MFSAVSFGGDFVLVGWLAHSVTGDSGWTGTAFALLFLPGFLLGAPAGSIADRYQRHHLIRVIELVAAGTMAAIAMVFAFGDAGLIHVLLMPLILGSLRAVQNPVRMSYAYDVVGADHAMMGIAGSSLGTRTGMIFGALSAGTLTESFGLSGAFTVMALAHVAAWAVLGAKGPATTHQVIDRDPILKNLAASLAELRSNRVLLALVLVTAVVEVFGTSFSTLVPVLTETRLSLGAEGIGWLFTAQAIGAFIAIIILFVRPPRERKGMAYFLVISGMGLAIVVLGWVDSLFGMLLVLGVIAAGISAWDVLTQSMMQLSVPEHLRGRAMGAWIFAIGSAPLGHLQIGLLATAVGADWALYGNGALVLVTVVVALLLSPSLRRL